MRSNQGLGVAAEGFSLRRAVLVAVVLHLLLGVSLQWWPGSLYSASLAPPPQAPLEFRFVDIPDAEPPPTPVLTETLSDRDRRAADVSARDDRETPFSEGNTAQQVLRAPPAVLPPVAASRASETTEMRPVETAESLVGDEVRTDDAAAALPAEANVPRSPSASLPPKKPSLSSSLARLESFIEPESFSNPEGGVEGPQGIVSFDTKGYDLGPYIRRILSIIERNWRANIPPVARMFDGASFVALSIERQRLSDGEENARIVVRQTWTSDIEAFDQAALFALEISNPLPPLPGYFPYDSMDGRIGFLYNLEPSQVTFPQD